MSVMIKGPKLAHFLESGPVGRRIKESVSGIGRLGEPLVSGGGSNMAGRFRRRHALGIAAAVIIVGALAGSVYEALSGCSTPLISGRTK